MKELFLNLFLGDLNPEQVRLLLRAAILVLLGSHILWSCGWVTIPGMQESGFARASEITDVKEEVASVKQDVKDIQLRLLVKDIELMQQRICEASLQGNRPAVKYAAERKTSMIRQYRQKTAQLPHIPTCAELGVLVQEEPRE